MHCWGRYGRIALQMNKDLGIYETNDTEITLTFKKRAETSNQEVVEALRWTLDSLDYLFKDLNIEIKKRR